MRIAIEAGWSNYCPSLGNLRPCRRFPIPMSEHSDLSRWSVAPFWATMAWLALLGACKPPPASRITPESAAASRGLAAIEKAGCGACHEIPGVGWPKGRTGPSLTGFDDAGLIAGRLANTPANLAAFVRNAPAVDPGSPMPPMPFSESEARDVAAFLYRIDDK